MALLLCSIIHLTPTRTFYTEVQSNNQTRKTHFDLADSIEINVDNDASRSLTYRLQDFIDKPVPANATIV